MHIRHVCFFAGTCSGVCVVCVVCVVGVVGVVGVVCGTGSARVGVVDGARVGVVDGARVGVVDGARAGSARFGVVDGARVGGARVGVVGVCAGDTCVFFVVCDTCENVNNILSLNFIFENINIIIF